MSITPVERRSYVHRRQLFKDIWNATMLFEDGDASDVKVKPKVIKTLRLEQSSHEKASLRKKRLKNLRTVCNKILDFCDHQEQDDLYYDQAVSSGLNAEKNLVKKSSKTKKKKIKMKKVKKSLPPSKDYALAKATDSEIQDRNVSDAAFPIDRARKRGKRAVPMAKAAVPMVASQITSKLTSTRSPLHTSSPSPVKQQKILKKKSSTKKKKSTDI